MSARWTPVATFASPLEADIAVARLRAAGIPARPRGNDIVGIFGPGFQGATARGVDVLVPTPEARRARVVLAAIPDAAEDPDDPDASE